MTGAGSKRRAGRASAAAATVALGAGLLLAGTPVAAAPPAPAYVERIVVPFPNLDDLSLGDFDEDGRPDLVGTQLNGEHLWVALASGPAGSYAPRTDTAISGSPTRPLVADLDDDGHQDILVGRGSGGFLWQLGNGDGTFGPLQTSSVGLTQPAVGDVVGSSHTDLVGLVGGVPTALVGDGTGSFTVTSTTFSIPGTANDLLVEDLDGDGHDDVAASVLAGSPIGPNPPSAITTFHARGDGTFEPGQTHEVISLLGEVDAGDLDGDGDLDLAVAAPRGSSQAGFYTLLGNGSGSFAAPVLNRIGHGPADVELTDVDGDSTLDVVLLDAALDSTFLVHGNGDGTFGSSVSYRSGWSARDQELIDVTGDGIRDLVNVTKAGGGRPAGVNIVPGRADHTFTGVASARFATTKAQSLGDLNGDGRPDLVASHPQASSLSGILNDGQGRLRPAVRTAVPNGPTGLATGRLDADGKDDVVAVSAKDLFVGLSTGDGSFEPVTTLLTATGLTTPVVGDLTGDHRNDIAVADGSSVKLLAGKGTGTFAAPVTLAGTSGIARVASGDLDGDGDRDLVGLRSSPAGVSVLRNDGSGRFTALPASNLPTTPQFIATADLDGDGVLDVAVTAGTGANAKLHPFYSSGDGGLVTGPPVVLPPSGASGVEVALSLTVADIDVDDRDDLLVDGTRIVRSDCAGSSRVTPTTFDAVEAPSVRADAVDMDGDGVLDLVGALHSGDAVVRFGAAAPSPAAASPGKPFTSCRQLVDRVHRDLLQRRPTASEANTLAAALAAGTSTRGDLVAQIRTSADHIADVDPVARLYRAYFLRSPDPGGLDYWVNRRRRGWTLIQISNQFARSSEFRTKYGALSNTEFVDLVYENVLGRAGDAGGRTFWINRLNTKRATRGQVMLNFSDSSEYRTKQAAEVDTGVLYAWLLRRRPTTPELDAAVAALEHGGTTAELATQLLDTAAYADRVGAG